MLPAHQMKVFRYLEDVKQIQKKCDSSESMAPVGQHKQKWEIVIVKNERRPQRNSLDF